jgi:NAD(P)-dependent dehydrogenase (short-subunit alcohol dehydrogenase family)
MRLRRSIPPEVPFVDMTGRICVVTGASSGIGLETARGLAARGATVVLVGRDPRRTRAHAESLGVAWETCDFASLADVRRLAAALRERYPAIHVLVNNAGLWLFRKQHSHDGIEMTLQVNHLAPFLFTMELLDALKRGAPARVVNVSSRLHEKERSLRLDDLELKGRRYTGLRAYRQSKLCNVLFSSELARRVSPDQITANSVHPGDVATNVVRTLRPLQWASDTLGKLYLLTPEEGARTSLHVATAPELNGTTGAYFANAAPRAPSALARDPRIARDLWAISEKLTGAVGPAR